MSRDNKGIQEKRQLSNNEEVLFDFASFLASSARGSLEEGTMAASLRLVDALSRLPAVCPDSVEKDRFLAETCKLVSRKMNSRFLTSRDKYIEFLDDVMKRFAHEVAVRNGLAKELERE